MIENDDLSAPCDDCEVDTFEIDEYYTVTDKVWNKVVPNDKNEMNHFLCIGCIEKRLGRKLTQQDFQMDLPINSRGIHSKRLQNRIDTI